jgi:hypothetical protein
MAYVDSHCPLAMEAQIQSQTSLCGICGGQSSTGTGFIQVLFSPAIVIPPMLCIYSFVTNPI